MEACCGAVTEGGKGTVRYLGRLLMYRRTRSER